MRENGSRRHCMIVHACYPLGETRVQREAEALLGHGYEVDVICLRSKTEQARDFFKGVNIYRLPVRRYKRGGIVVQLFEYLMFFILAMFKVSWLHWRHRYSTVQVHNLPDFLVFAAWMPRWFGARLILDLHDLMPEFYMGRFHKSFDSWPVRLVRLQERLSCRFAHHVITVSHHWRQTLIERGVPAEKVSVVMNVADEKIFKRPLNKARQAQSGEGLRLVYHGMVTYRYGLDLVLQAIARLRPEMPDIYFTLLGDGLYIKTLMHLADELDLGDQVTLNWRFLPAEKLPGVILNADVGVVPYRNDPFTDGLVPTKLMEYAALGLPSIAARTTAIEAYFADTMVEFFEPGDLDDLVRCIRGLYENPERLTELARGSEKFNQRYNWASISAEYVALVERLGTR